jgi:queuine tRNA-ribosyltransferase
MDLEILKEKYFFMPDATRGAVRYLTTKQLEETGTQAIVTNTLHLLIHPGPDVIQQLGGIKKMMNWSGIVFTDSGGFQLFSLLHSKKWKGEINENGATFKSPKQGNTYNLTPESSIDIQMKIGSDVLVTLDDCTDTGLSRKEAEKSVERTLKWAVRCKEHFNKEYGGSKKTGKLLTCVVQGSNFLDLREYCAKELSKIGFDGYNFGGYVVDKDGELVLDEMNAVIENIPRDTIRYAMGVGKPEDILKSSKIGYNLFDTVLVTRNARHGTVYTSQGVLRIKNSDMALDQRPIDSKCNCECCKNYSRAYLHHMLKNQEATALTLLTIHNLTYYQDIIKNLNTGI